MNDREFDAKYEREVADTTEAEQLRKAIFNALETYADYLDRHGLIWDLAKLDSGDDALKAEKLVAQIDFRSTEEIVGPTFEIVLKGSALDRQSTT